MPIRLVVSDVDGTLVTPDKRLTDASIRAVRRLHESGIGFTVASSRPPFGMRRLVEALSLRLPIGVFNGAAIVNPDLSAIEQHLVAAEATRRSIDVFARYGAAVWLFTDEAWLAQDAASAYVALEEKTIEVAPQIVDDFGPYLTSTAKIVGSGTDFTRLSAAEAALREALGAAACVMRSQPFYVDVTAPDLDKGRVVDALARSLGIRRNEIAVLGDMDNDVPMFRQAGLAIAMGNASPAVQQAAHCITASNLEDGFAQAIERYVLPHTRA